ncbi:ABC transporter ATP-binding protein [Gibbsiella dentisursi]|uniref:ABC transporter ATP-binding protein n=1 Tax=Gibbsiella dentisursi TaxID=796890 RepID=A0ABP7KM36_9GAMM
MTELASMQITQPSAVTQKIKMRTLGLSKRYGAFTALHPIDLDVRDGELMTLLGPSGSGKTTLLQLISGLTEPSAGELYIDGEPKTHTPSHQRDIGVVFQNYALFPQMSVFENIAFPLKMRAIPGGAIKTKVVNALEMVGLGAHGQRFPHELSGGQQQRVALARSLVYQPSILLMDESLSALDRKLRESIQVEIKRIHRETGSTIIFVTHDQDEALALSDRVCLMNAGRIEQIDTPSAVYEYPKTLFAADFIGVSNKLTGVVDSDGGLHTPDGTLPLPKYGGNIASGDRATLIIRPEYIQLVADNGFLHGQVIEQIYAGAEIRLLIKLKSGAVLTVRRPAGGRVPEVGEYVALQWQAANARLLTR